MDINEKTSRPEGQSEENKPREGKRPGNGRHNHHRRGNRPPRPQGCETQQTQPVAEGEASSMFSGVKLHRIKTNQTF